MTIDEAIYQAVADERERCAQAAANYSAVGNDVNAVTAVRFASRQIAAAIRAGVSPPAASSPASSPAPQ